MVHLDDRPREATGQRVCGVGKAVSETGYLNPSNEKDLVFLIVDLSGYTALTEARGNVSAVKVVA